MTKEDANEIARVQKLKKGIITSDGSVYKKADPETIQKHCEDHGLEMFHIGKEEPVKAVEEKMDPSKSKKDNGVK